MIKEKGSLFMDFYNGEMKTGGNTDNNFGMNMPNGGMAGMDMTGNIPTLYPAFPGAGMGSAGNEMPLGNFAIQPGMQNQDYSAPVMPAGGTTSPEMQQFLEQGYLMGPNCFGRDSQAYGNQLLEYINDEYHDYLYYTALTRRAPTAGGRRLFRNIANDEMKHARRWAAAYFLITGKRYFPTRADVPPVTVPANFNTALRDRYMAESRDAIKYRQFASQTSDLCLKRMAIDTSDDERQHAQDILRLIQNM